MKHNQNQRGFHYVGLVLLAVVLAVIGVAGWRVFNNQKQSRQPPSKIIASDQSALDKAITAGKYLSENKCQGTKKLTFTKLPMNEQDFSILIPYGLTVGGHVTPIDHQYFEPVDHQSPRATYPGYAMADAPLPSAQ